MMTKRLKYVDIEYFQTSNPNSVYSALTWWSIYLRLLTLTYFTTWHFSNEVDVPTIWVSIGSCRLWNVLQNPLMEFLCTELFDSLLSSHILRYYYEHLDHHVSVNKFFQENFFKEKKNSIHY